MLSVTSWCLMGLKKEQWPQYLNMIHKTGFGGIEIHIEAGNYPICLDTETEELGWMLDAVKEADLKITGVSTMLHMDTPITSKEPERKELALAVFYKMLALAKWAGARHVSIVPGGRTEHWKDVFPVVKELNEKAKKAEMPLILENVWYSFTRNLSELEKLVNALDDSNIGYCFDIGNAYVYGNLKQWLGRLGTNIKKIHLSDSIREPNLKICPLGQGGVDWLEIAEQIKEMKYTGDLTLELFPREGVSMPMEIMRTFKYLQRYFD